MSGSADERVVFLLPYLGDWPRWMPLFLRSCATNPAAHFVLLGDRTLAQPLPANVSFTRITTDEVEERVRSRLGVNLRLRDPHKLCDLRPFFPTLFAEIVEAYDFWGYCDLDMVFGDLSRVLDRESLRNTDVFSAWDGRQLVGHFTLLRGSPEVSAIAFEIEQWKDRVSSVPGSTFMDEGGLTVALRAHPELRWRHARDVRQEFSSGRAAVGATLLHNGRVFELDTKEPAACLWDGRRTFVREPGRDDLEVLYIHFMGLKRPYQWAGFDPSKPYPACSFSPLGFHERLLQTSELHSFGHRMRVEGARGLAWLVAATGRALPRDLKARVMRPLRRG